MEFETRVFSCLVTRDARRDCGLIARATEKATDGPHLSGPKTTHHNHHDPLYSGARCDPTTTDNRLLYNKVPEHRLVHWFKHNINRPAPGKLNIARRRRCYGNGWSPHGHTLHFINRGDVTIIIL